MLSLALSAYEHKKKNTRQPSCALKKISKSRGYFSTEKENFQMSRFEKGIIIVSNLIILVSFISGVISGNNWNSTGMRVLSVASLSMNLIILEYMLVVIRNK
jgi:hypothetical protein